MGRRDGVARAPAMSGACARRILLFLLVATALADTQAFAGAQSDQVDALFAQRVEPQAPGCSVAVFRDGEIIHSRGYGMADLAHGIANTPSTVFHVASVSKQFASAAVVLLAQDGRLSLDDSVRKYVPELPALAAPITVRQLLNHTSGMRDAFNLLLLSGWRYPIDLLTDRDVLNVLARQRELNFAPGTQFRYSNTGHTLAALIVQRVSGKALREFAAERIFRPLGMKATHFHDDHAEVVPNVALGYVRDGDGYKFSPQNLDAVGASGLFTTVGDLAKWDANFYHGKVGGAALAAHMLERGVLRDGRTISYALGVRVGSYRGLPTVWHTGTLTGYRAYLIRFPEQRFGVACLCNNAAVSPVEASRGIADIYLAKDLQPLPQQPAVTLPETQLSRLTGVYLRRDGREARRVVLRDGRLELVDSDGEGASELKHVDDRRFQVGERDDYAEFSGSPLRLTLTTDWEDPRVFDLSAPYAPDATHLAQYAGTYVSEELELPYRVFVKEGGLAITSMKALSDMPMKPFTTDLFIAGDLPTLRFTRDAQGRVSGFLLNDGRLVDVRYGRAE
jgi:CubicO group peptidase (beta-lactamase class C family)